MDNNKVEQIKQLFSGVGPKLGAAYSNKEIVDGSIELQGAIARDFADRMQLDISRDRDILSAIETMAEEYHLQETETFLRLRTNFTEMGYTIASFIKGMNGEKIAKRALKLISFDKGVKVLYNIALEDEDAQAEYDAIVVAPYGIFVIEVKNWAAAMRIDERGMILREDGSDITYDLPGRMSIKEGLLREFLGELFTTDYQGIVLFSNERARVQDEYKKIPLSFGGSIVYDIRQYGKGRPCMDNEQVNRIVETIEANNKEQKTISKVDSEAIVEDYAKLVAMIDGRIHDAKKETLAVLTETSAEEVMTDGESGKVQDCEFSAIYKKLMISRSKRQAENRIWERASWRHAVAVAFVMITAGVGALTVGKSIRL